MKVLITNLIIQLLSSLYTSSGVSLVVAFLFVALYLTSKATIESGLGLKSTVKKVWKLLLKNKSIRLIFWLAYYTGVVLNNTLVNRIIWPHPLSELLGGWGFFYITMSPRISFHLAINNFDIQALENIVMLMPYAFLAILAFPEWFKRKGYIKGTFLAGGGLSLFIETAQLIFRMGTFQISDLVYNTGGAMIIGFIVKLFMLPYRKKDNMS